MDYKLAKGITIAATIQAAVIGTIVLYSCGSQAADTWTDKQVNLGITWGVLQTIDYSQTLYIAKRPKQYYEKESSRYIGEHPSTNRVTNHFIVTTGIKLAIMHYLPSEYRTMFQYVNIVYTGNIVYQNYRIGIGLDIPF